MDFIGNENDRIVLNLVLMICFERIRWNGRDVLFLRFLFLFLFDLELELFLYLLLESFNVNLWEDL